MRNLSNRVHNGADVIDSRDVIERINALADGIITIEKRRRS